MRIAIMKTTTKKSYQDNEYQLVYNGVARGYWVCSSHEKGEEKEANTGYQVTCDNWVLVNEDDQVCFTASTKKACLDWFDNGYCE